MPAAPSLEILLDTQRHFEDGLSAYFTANGISQEFISRENVNMPDARIEGQFQAGASTVHQATRTTTKTGWPEQDEFNGVYVIRVQTDRPVDNVSPVSGFKSKHDYWVARAKFLMLRGAINGTIAGVTALNVDYHSLAVQGFGGQMVSVESDTFDVTELAYPVIYRISPDAWPTPSTP